MIGICGRRAFRLAEFFSVGSDHEWRMRVVGDRQPEALLQMDLFWR